MADDFLPWQTKGGLFGAEVNYVGLDPNTIAQLSGTQWTANFTDYQLAGAIPATKITYWFPQASSEYNFFEPDRKLQEKLDTFAPVTPVQENALLTTLSLISSYTLLTFDSATSADTAALRFSRYTLAPTPPAEAAPSTGGYPPEANYNAAASGDMWLARNGDVAAGYFGSDAFSTIIHELGHTLGLKHGHETSPNGALERDFDNHQFSVMTYRPFTDAPIVPITAEVEGSAPQSYMMFDISALQSMYGANFGRVGQTDTYRWDEGTGQQFINDRQAPNTGISATHKIFSTVWTQGAISTYDLGNFHQDQVDDMRPGHWMTFSDSQLADLNVDDQSPRYRAAGNVYNALLYHGDMRSLIDNLITGGGNDTIWGNDKGNSITSNGGNDEIHAGAGDDVVTGGLGLDIIDSGPGYDTVRDTPDGLNGDFVRNFGEYLSIDYIGVRVGLSQIRITVEGEETSFKLGESTIGLNGVLADGAYMATPRGTDADMHTTVKFVPYMPDLEEGHRVFEDSINGIINRAFLTGDGAVHFTATLEAAISSMSNMLGYYKIGADGMIFDVHLLFANTQTAGAGTLDLGTPGNGVQLGFFLIQDGFTRFGSLADNLSFVTPGTLGPANVGDGQTLLLASATHGLLNGATIFHSLSQLNPGELTQVLSGTDAAAHDIWVGFEDLLTSSGDNDFQDVVLRIHSTADLLYGV